MGIYLLFYIGIPVIYYVFSFFSNKNNNVKVTKNYNVFIAILLILLCCLRSIRVGKDNKTYEMIYFQLSNTTLLKSFKMSIYEWGFIVINRVAKFVWDDYRFIIVASSIFSISILCRFIIKNSKISWLSWMLYIGFGFLIYPMSGIRACIAMSFGLICFEYLKKPVFKKNIAKYYLFAFIAFLFHKTSAVYFLLYPLLKIKNKRIFALISVVIFITLLLFGKLILQYLVDNFYQGYTLVSSGGLSIFVLFLFELFVYLLFFYNDYKNDEEMNVYFRILIIQILFQVLTLRFALFSRVVELVSIVSICFLPLMVNKFKKSERTIIIIAIIVGITYLFLTSSDGAGLIPYRFFWED